MKFIGVDIGKSGGLVALNLEGVVIECIKTPESHALKVKHFRYCDEESLKMKKSILG